MDSDGKLTNRKVTVGINDSVKAEIRDGLSEGEKVVIGQASTTSAPTNGGGGPPPMGF
jgi:macrolide-specific efflux system membrane fusion protein